MTGSKSSDWTPKVDGPLSPLGVLRAVAVFFKVAERGLMDPSDLRENRRPRQILVWLLRRRLGDKYEAIGAFAQRHHSTVIYSVQKIDREMDTYKRDIAAIEKIMGVD